MAYPMSSSPISPVNLPKPYDISAAVHQALKLEIPASPTADDVPNHIEHNNTSHDQDIDIHDSTSSGDVDELLPNVMDGSDYIDDVWDNVTLPEEIVDTDAWGENTSANIDELERFCRYIDGENEMDEDFEDSFNSPEKKDRSKINISSSSGRGSSSRASRSLQYVQTELVNSELWEEFNKIGTEMVITKNGRRMFPPLNLQVYGLNPDAVYSVYLDIMPADDRRYKFMQTEWVPIGRIDKKFHFREYIHPDSPNTGQYWMEKPILFKLLKLTNNKSTVHKDQIILNSMQKYQPSLRIKFHSQLSGGQETKSFPFPESSFIAVTAYQNNKITQLKIDNNPYARAFRDATASENNDGAERDQRKSNKRQTRSASTTPSPPFRNRSVKTHVVKSEGSATSVESGFESGSSSSEIISNPRLHLMQQQQQQQQHNGQQQQQQQQYLPPPPSLLPLPHSSESPYGCPFNYWADENSLYNSALIYPPPLLDSTVSFSEPFLHQSSQAFIEAQIPNISPIKPLQMTADSLYPVPPSHAPVPLTGFHSADEYEDNVFT